MIANGRPDLAWCARVINKINKVSKGLSIAFAARALPPTLTLQARRGPLEIAMLFWGLDMRQWVGGLGWERFGELRHR